MDVTAGAQESKLERNYPRHYTHSRLRSGTVEQLRTMSASESEPAIESPKDVAEAPLVQELRQKLEMARGDLSV